MIFIQVKLLKGFPEPLWYTAPEDLAHACTPGALVRVPLRAKTTLALIEQTSNTKPNVPFALREMVGLEPVPKDPHHLPFIKQLALYHQMSTTTLLKRSVLSIKQKEKAEKTVDVPEEPEAFHNTIQLTAEQQQVVNTIVPALHNQTYKPLLLHGVTGSGKTEVYKQVIIEAIGQNKTVLLLLPEVTLAAQFETLLRNQLPTTIPLFGFHSATSIKQKRLLWKSLVNAQPLVIIGVHLPVLLPIANLGCIIIDEEHEVGYQEKKHPKINSKEAALMRARIANIPIILGSGTPSVSSLYNVHNRGWELAALTQRFAGNFPSIEIVSLTEKKERKNFWISLPLEHAIKKQLANKEQTIIFLNRRGYSFFVQCKQCAYVIMCANCSVSLTLHENNQLSCHYCGTHTAVPLQCTECKATDDPFLKKGIGTQQVVTILQKLFPQARIARADLDTTVNKKKWQQIMSDMQTGAIDILVGTQTITKGYHFPKVTLVGILWADLNLHLPLYNAAETTLQQLIQVAGRAGRATQHSKVIAQTMISHPVYDYLAESAYQQFYTYELQKRKILGYPPHKRFAEIELKNTSELALEADAKAIAARLAACAAKHNVLVLGPSKPPVSKIKNVHSRKIYLKGALIADIHTVYQAVRGYQCSSSIFFTPNSLC